MDRRCDSCDFWAATDAESGECRRRSPTPLLRWVQTECDEWCGEFKPKGHHTEPVPMAADAEPVTVTKARAEGKSEHFPEAE